jgi:hypothetical protein
VWDSDAYGVDTDSAESWEDNFFPRRAECEEAQAKYEQVMHDVIEELADDFGLDTTEWDSLDYSQFKEILGI